MTTGQPDVARVRRRIAVPVRRWQVERRKVPPSGGTFLVTGVVCQTRGLSNGWTRRAPSSEAYHGSPRPVPRSRPAQGRPPPMRHLRNDRTATVIIAGPCVRARISVAASTTSPPDHRSRSASPQRSTNSATRLIMCHAQVCGPSRPPVPDATPPPSQVRHQRGFQVDAPPMDSTLTCAVAPHCAWSSRWLPSACNASAALSPPEESAS